MSNKINHLSHFLNANAVKLGIDQNAQMTYDDYRYMAEYMAEYSYPIVTINKDWEVLYFQSFSLPPMIARVGHRHAVTFKIVGHHGSVGCECIVPDEVLVLIELECFEKGATLILGETFKPV